MEETKTRSQRNPGNPRNNPVTTYLTKKEYEWLKKFCNEHECSTADVLRSKIMTEMYFT